MPSLPDFSTISVATVVVGVLGVLFTIAGTCGQLVALNFWLDAFPGGPGNFTVLTLVAWTVTFGMGVVFAGWVAVRRPKLAFVLQPQALGLLFLTGLCYSLNGVLLVFATPDTPELLQAMLLSTTIFWTFAAAGLFEIAQRGCTSFRAMDRRAILVPVSFVLCTAGVIVGAGTFKFGDMSAEAKKWTVIFGVSIIPAAVLNVISGHFMATFTEASTDPAVATTMMVSTTFRSNDLTHNAVKVSDPTTVKLVLILGSSFVQGILLFCYFPLDWTPGYGTSPNAATSAATLRSNYRCVFFGDGCSADNFAYFVAFSLSYAASMVGNTLLNQISPPLCSMVTQLATPCGALLLIIVPAWNVNGSSYQLGSAIGALILVTLGSVIYVYWARFLQSDSALALAGDHAEAGIAVDGMLQNEYGACEYDAYGRQVNM